MNYTDRWVSGQRSYADVAGTGLSVLLVTATMTERTLANLADLVDSQSDYIVELRHRLHRIPEQGFCEVKTAAVIADELRKLDLDIRTDVGETGIVADLVTGRPGKYVAVRADMDGLPLKEATGADYASENEGFSHSCGHDGHAAALVGAARILAQIRDQLVGKVRFVFQPAEEICQGAGAMIDCGVLEPGPPEAILGFHAWPGLPSDTVACRKGTMMASCDVLTIKVSGKGGHGARPELARNPLVGMARVVDALSTLDNHERIVSLCTARVGSQANIIAGSGRLSGTVRALNQQVRDTTIAEIISSVDHICGQMGLQGQVSFEAMSPAVIVDERLYDIFRQVGAELLGADKVVELEAPSMGSEDFGRYLDHVPGLLFRVGVGRDCPGLHSADFDFNDDALKTAMLMLCGMTVRVCTKGLC
ncbi:MAG: M20 metallopeptidase family protein [Planctomycetota bacterium]